MSWRAAVSAFLAWVAANTFAGALFALGSAPFVRSIEWWGLPIEGLFAGIVLGLAQWLALRPFLPELRLWAPVTIVASPFSWSVGYLFGLATLTLGGWFGTGISAAGQTVLMVRSFQGDRLLVGLSFLWIPSAMLGGAFFYFGYLFALEGVTPAFVMIFAGCICYAIFTGLIVALLAGLAARRRLGEPAIDGAR